MPEDDKKAKAAKSPNGEKPAKEKIPKADSEKEKKYKPRAKPDISPSEKIALDLRQDKNRRRPEFHRQEWFRYKRVGTQWRKPRGIHSKLRRHFSGEPGFVSIGYRGPKAARGRHPSGFQEVMVFNAGDLDNLDPKKQAVRIGHSVGYLKRMHIALKADEMNLRILNFDRATHDELLAEAKKRGIELPSKEAEK